MRHTQVKSAFCTVAWSTAYLSLLHWMASHAKLAQPSDLSEQGHKLQAVLKLAASSRHAALTGSCIECIASAHISKSVQPAFPRPCEVACVLALCMMCSAHLENGIAGQMLANLNLSQFVY